MTPTQHSLNLLRQRGYLATVCESWIRGCDLRRDLLGIGDILAVGKSDTILCQTTSDGNLSSRYAKVCRLESAAAWLEHPARRIVIHGWRRNPETGRPEVRELELTQSDVQPRTRRAALTPRRLNSQRQLALA